jgi:hypothetical protein
MAITTKDAIELYKEKIIGLNKDEKCVAVAIEIAIDEHIRKEFNGLDVEFESQLDPITNLAMVNFDKIKEELIRKYEQAGWVAEISKYVNEAGAKMWCIRLSVPPKKEPVDTGSFTIS